MPMLVSNPFGEDSRSFLVGNELGESYKVVKTVYENLDPLKQISSDPNIQELASNVQGIIDVSQNLDVFTNLNAALNPEIMAIIPTIPEKAQEVAQAVSLVTQAQTSVVSLEASTKGYKDEVATAKVDIDRVGQEVQTTKDEANKVLTTTKQVQAEVLEVKTQVDSLSGTLIENLQEVRDKHTEVVAKAKEVSTASTEVANAKTEVLSKVSLAQSSAEGAKQSEQAVNAIKNSLTGIQTTVNATAEQVATNKTVVETKANEAKASADASAQSALEAKQYASDASKGQVQTDWNEVDTGAITYIKNKPVLGALASKDSVAYTEVTGTPKLGSLATKNSVAYSEVTGTPTLGALASKDTLSFNALTDKPTLGSLASKNSVSTALLENASVNLSKLAPEVTQKLDSVDSKIQTQISAVKTELNPKIQSNTEAIASAESKVTAVTQELSEFKNSFGSSDKYVKTEAQTLSEPVKTQVRTNIDVFSKTEVSEKITPVSNSLTEVKNTYIKNLAVEDDTSGTNLVITKGDNTQTKVLFSQGSVPEGIALEADIMSAVTKAVESIPSNASPSPFETTLQSLNTRLSKLEGNLHGSASVVEFNIEANSWYKKWSNGWVEQGGFLQAFNDNNWHLYTVTLLVPFRDTAYYVMGGSTFSNANSGVNYAFTVTPSSQKTTSSFQVSATGGAGDGISNRPSWYACGMAQ